MPAPLDQRLWRYSAPARSYLLVTVGLSLLTSGAIIVCALLLSAIVAGVITNPAQRELAAWTPELIALAAALAMRAAAAWAQSYYGLRAAGRVTAGLNQEVLAATVRRAPQDMASRHARLAPLLTRGTQDLQPYLTGYLPALFLAVLVPPAVIVCIALQDWISAAIVAVTLPLIPLFMVLIGLLTRGRSARTLATMTTLSTQLLDLLAGLPTLRALGRERGPIARVRELGQVHRTEAMSALRLAFLSSMVLELLATLSVAMVAVSIGMRLVFGEMTLQAGMAALILAPEAYHPLRQLGERFHAAEDGVAAASAAFAELDDPTPAPQTGSVRPDLAAGIVLDAVSCRARSGLAPARLSAHCRPGQLTVLTGPNGCGKTSALHLILGLASPAAGRVLVGGVEIAQVEQAWWWRQLGWLPQRPVLVPGTLRENLELAGYSGDRLEKTAAATGFDEVLAAASAGWETVIGADGTGLALGERQRLALTRVLLTPKPVLLLDEPTAHLDAASEARVLAELRARARAGAVVIVVAHRDSVLHAADEVIEVCADAG